MADVSRLAVDAAVFDSDHEVIGEQRRKNLDVALFVGFGPLHLERANGVGIGFLLRGEGRRGDHDQSKGPGTKYAHSIYVAQSQRRNKFLKERPPWCQAILIDFA